MKSYMLIVFPIDLIKLNLLSAHVECVRAGQRYFQVYKTTKHVFAIIYSLLQKAFLGAAGNPL